MKNRVLSSIGLSSLIVLLVIIQFSCSSGEEPIRNFEITSSACVKEFNPNYAIEFVMRFKRTKNQRVMDEKHSIAMVKDIT